VDYEDTISKPSRGLAQSSKPQFVSDIKISEIERLGSGNIELDRALGGGFAPGSLILVGGDPGIGKSTLLLTTCANLGGASVKVLYITGEESAEQVKIRANRLQVPNANFKLLCETNLKKILSAIQAEEPDFLVIDSIQTCYKEDVQGAPGSVTQIRECTLELMVQAKTHNCITVLVGHVTKEGSIAGPKILEHMVDTVVYFEGDRNHQYRILRTIKNRFGSTSEIGVFEMTATGLLPVANPSSVFLQASDLKSPGSLISCTLEGSRSLLFEIQALVSSSAFSVPQRVALGIDQKRLTIILAILEKSGGMQIGMSDVFVSVVGGLKIDDPALDLACALAIATNHINKTTLPQLIALGELGLNGEIRSVSQIELRLKEAQRLGFKNAIIPKNAKVKETKKIKLIPS
jgi:DNA repair protein RadA/Sms